MKNILFLYDKIPWFGSKSGYECLVDTYSLYNTKTITPNNSLFSKIRGKLLVKANRIENINSSQCDAFYRFNNNISNKNISNHILYLEDYITLISKNIHAVATIHQPIEIWKTDNLNKLKNLNKLIILYERDIEYFSKYVPGKKLKFIRHGIDTNYFEPSETKPNVKKILIVGHYLRNFPMLLSVLKEAKKMTWYNDIEISILIPPLFRSRIKELSELGLWNNVKFYQNLSDSELVQLYQESWLLLLPMDNSGANTAIIQSLSCGVPVLTTNVGGIGSYGGNSIYPTVENGDTKGMLELLEEYIVNETWHNEQKVSVRKFAEDFLDWNDISKQHIDFYNS